MEIKGEILRILRSGKVVSGEEISKKLEVSRVAIWKHIQTLKEHGYVIQSSPKGYHLVKTPDLLFPWEFSKIKSEVIGKKIYHFMDVPSTMDVARDFAERGEKEGTLVIAEAQTKGRGRLGRDWISIEGGLYISLILKPKIKPSYAHRATIMSSVAIAKTIDRLYNLDARVKWPNDVLIGENKIGGILAEMKTEMDIIHYVIAGIGININNDPPEKENTTSIKKEVGKEVSRVEFTKSLVDELDKRYSLIKNKFHHILREWRSLSSTLGRLVKVVTTEDELEGYALDIDDNGSLLLKLRDDTIKRIFAGDCTHLRKKHIRIG